MQRPSQIVKAIGAALGPHGCSRVATEVFYHLWGKENGFTPVHVGTHWLLEHRPSGFIIDIMASSDALDYEAAVPGFIGKLSKRAQKVIADVRG